MKKLIDVSDETLKIIESEAKRMNRSVKAQLEFIVIEEARKLNADDYMGGNQKFNI